jgi:GT2 family glycosyltransferase/glycosyltransferase involved in cell wall biosynthesis
MIRHVVIGPDRHGVVAHSQLIAAACGHEALRAATAGDVSEDQLAGADVVHAGFTDRLFGDTIDQAVEAVARLAEQVRAAGACLSLTLHDVPHDDSPLQQRRRHGYQQVIALARGVVVNSQVELGLVHRDAESVHSLRVAPLPVLAPAQDQHCGPGAAAGETGAPQVAVLGYLYPDRGYEDVIDAAPRASRVLALGQPSRGHEDLAAQYAAYAAERGVSWEVTGYLSDVRLAQALAAVTVPVAPNRRVTASASVNTWTACGRRVLMPDSPLGRELDRTRPGHVLLYDPDDPAALASAVADAIADPGLTYLPKDTGRGPALESVAQVYREHLDSCRPPRLLSAGPGQVAVPGNRWDLLARPRTAARPLVSVVIPYYQNQPGLDLVLAALDRQSYPRERLEIVVADDGSAQAPDTAAAGGTTVAAVWQENRGFRAAAARNLGAARARGDVLLFLDGDTVPEADFVRRLARLPARCADVIAVGRRRHARLSGWTPAEIGEWFAGRLHPAELPEPAWLRQAYRHSGDLRRVDQRSYRYLISAVLGMSRALFEELGGFDERFVSYGGEDWELAHRGYVAGALLAHVRQAVAWHDGPDWAGRSADLEAKNTETASLARLLPDPAARGRGQWFPYPSVLVFAPRLGSAPVLALARSAFAAGADCHVWADDDVARELADPRIHGGAPAPDQWARAGFTACLTAPADLADLPVWCALADQHGTVHAGPVTVQSARARNRSRRHAAGVGAGERSLSAYLFGQRDHPEPRILDPASLELLLPSL